MTDAELNRLYQEELLKADIRDLTDEIRVMESYLRAGSAGRTSAHTRICLRINQSELAKKTQELEEF